MIGPHAINSSPLPTTKTTPCSSQIRAGKDGEASRGANCQRRAGKKEKGPTLPGICPWGGVRTSPGRSSAQSRVPGEPLFPSLGSFHLRNLPIALHQNRRAGGAHETNQPMFLLPPESVAFSPFSKASRSEEAEPAIPQGLMALQEPRSPSSSLPLVPLAAVLPIPLAIALVAAHHPVRPRTAASAPLHPHPAALRSASVTDKPTLDPAGLEAEAETKVQCLSHGACSPSQPLSPLRN